MGKKNSSQGRLRAAALLAVFALLTLAGPAAGVAFAQSPTPSPSPSSGASFSNGLARMVIEAQRIIPHYINEIEGPISGWFTNVAQLLAAAVVMTAFLRLLRQNQGGSLDLGWWFARVAFCVAMIPMSTAIINWSSSMGNAIAIGSGEGNSFLNKVRLAQQESFNDSYAKFQAGTFTVRVKGEDLPVNPHPDPKDPTQGIIGVLYDKETKLGDLQAKLDVSAWSMGSLFSFLSFCRGVMEFGDFILLIIRSFLLIGVRLLAPFMIALAIDREHAKQSAYKFAWGVAILTLVFPIVQQLVRVMAYTAGNLALSLGDKEPLYIWDKATMTAMANQTGSPKFIIVFLGIVMFIAGVAMIFTPVIAYKVTMGEMYQVVSNVVSGVTGGMVSTGIGVVSAQAAAAVNKQAEMTQVGGQAEAQSALVAGRRDAAAISAKGNEVASVAAARGSMIAQLASIEGARQAGVMQVASAAAFGRDQTMSSTNAQVRETGISNQRSTSMIWGQDMRDQKQASGEQQAAGIEARITRGYGAIPVLGAPLGEIVESKITTGPREIRFQTASESSTEYARRANSIENTYAGNVAGSQQQFGADMQGAYDRKEGRDIAAVNTQAGIAAGGAASGTAVTIGGIHNKYSYDMQANQREFEAGMKSVEITKQTGEKVADLHHVAASISAAGSIIANQSSNLFRELRF